MLHLADNLEVMRAMDAETVDLVYLDPPFNSKRDYGEFKDTWLLSDIEPELLADIAKRVPIIGCCDGSNRAYLTYMAVRLIELRRLLKPTGSLYLHCDATSSHYLKLLLDIVFGHQNFRNEIIWHYENKLRDSRKRQWQHATDTILFYSDSDSDERTWNPPLMESKRLDNVLRVPMLTSHRERVGYPTQKPVALLERIIKASSNRGDLVLDPFCGSGTTLVAAQNLGRRWLGIDANRTAISLARQRLATEQPQLCFT